MPPEPPKVIPSEPSSTTTVDPNPIAFVTSISPSTASSTTIRSTTTTTEADYPEPDPIPNGTLDPIDSNDIEDPIIPEESEFEPTPTTFDEPNRRQSNIPPFFGRPGILAGKPNYI